MNFETTLRQLKDWKKVRRDAWVKWMYLSLQFPTDKSKMTVPYLYYQNPNGDLIPTELWNTDLLADDWKIIVEEKSIDKMSEDEFFEECMKNVPKEMRSEEKDQQGRDIIKIFLKNSDRKSIVKQFNEVTWVMKELFDLLK